MKTIKIIDLFNKIVNGEEVPLKIKWDGYLWDFKKEYNDYWNEEEQEYLFFAGFDNFQDAKEFLNEKVKIIEEEQEQEIEQIGSWYEILSTESKQTQLQELNHNFNVIFDRLEQLINAVNESKNKED